MKQVEPEIEAILQTMGIHPEKVTFINSPKMPPIFTVDWTDKGPRLIYSAAFLTKIGMR